MRNEAAWYKLDVKRRLLAFYIALCVLAGIAAIPAAPLLVCRYTGKPMPREARACCVTPPAGGDALDAACCCRIAQAPQQADAPAALPVPFAAAVAWAPAPPALFPPTTAASAACRRATNSSVPRAPPPRSGPARAPPAFS